ncbi:MAG: NAD(P) transhydrogenase subunit alpha [Acidimicrobiia bacterium]|nr:NAD(P) transhydrogenase subunit alpha [Acidimicrobiia bacterium]
MHLRLHRETRPGERRVALVPRDVERLVKAGHTVTVPSGAGDAAGFPDAHYAAAGAALATGTPASADVVIGIGPLHAADLGGAKAVIALLDPLADPDTTAAIAATGASAFALEMLPRTTLAQAMDVLSSQATAAGYEAVLLGARTLPRFLPMMTTAAGTIRPATVLVLGAGVAGLQAIATAKRLGAVVYGYDIRPAARDQIESLGARFVGGPVAAASEGAGGYAAEVDEATRAAQQQALAAAVAAADIVITTAQVPGRRAPVLVTSDMVETMKPGAVLVDVAASSGGNCELTKADEVVTRKGVTILGPTDLASATAGNASEMFSRNVVTLFEHLQQKGGFDPEPTDEIVKGCRVAFGGKVVEPRVLAALSR